MVRQLKADDVEFGLTADMDDIPVHRSRRGRRQIVGDHQVASGGILTVGDVS
jgi:hypothetical protein